MADQDIIDALMSKFGMDNPVAGNQPDHRMQGMKRGPSVHSTNADERASMRQVMERADMDEDYESYPEGTDGQISDHLWKTIQEVDPKDGEKFYQLPGKEAFATLGMDTKSNADLADFWDRMSPEDRYYIVRALDSSIGGAASNEDIMEGTGNQKAADEQSVIDMMMDMNK